MTKRIFLTGATGSMGLAAAREMIADGHQVFGTTRSREGASALRALGATPVTADLFNEKALEDAMRGSDVVAHFATSIPSGFSARRIRLLDHERPFASGGNPEADRGGRDPRYSTDHLRVDLPCLP